MQADFQWGARKPSAAFVYAAVLLLMSVAAEAKPRTRASAAPALDAQTVNAARLSAPSAKGRARAAAHRCL